MNTHMSIFIYEHAVKLGVYVLPRVNSTHPFSRPKSCMWVIYTAVTLILQFVLDACALKSNIYLYYGTLIPYSCAYRVHLSGPHPLLGESLTF